MRLISDRIADDLQSIIARGPPGLGQEDVQRWSKELGCSEAQAFEQIALYLAHGYHHARLDFDFCDTVISNLWGWSVIELQSVGIVVTEVYLAFDDGEFRHADDAPDVDPRCKYTRAHIANIVERYRDWTGDV